MVELIRRCGYLSLEKTFFRRSHSSEKYVQEEDNRCARSSMVVNKLISSAGNDCLHDFDSVVEDLC